MNTIDQLFEQDFNDDWKAEPAVQSKRQFPGDDGLASLEQLGPSKKVKKEPLENMNKEDMDIVRILENDVAYKSDLEDVALATPNSLTPGSECDDKEESKTNNTTTTKPAPEVIEIDDDDEVEVKAEDLPSKKAALEPTNIQHGRATASASPSEQHFNPDDFPADEFAPLVLPGGSHIHLPQDHNLVELDLPSSNASPVLSSAHSSVSPSLPHSLPSSLPASEALLGPEDLDSKQNMDKYLGDIFNLAPEDDFFACSGPDNSVTDSFASVRELKQQLLSQHTLMTTYTSLKDVYQRVCKSLKDRNAENRRLANHMKVLVGVIEQNHKKIFQLEDTNTTLRGQTKTLDKEKKALQNTIKEMHKSTDGLSKMELLRLTINLRDAEIVRLKQKCGEL